MADNRVAGTLFVDMKYIYLYHKLGFREEATDIYTKKYPDVKISIESEKQFFTFVGNDCPLTAHHDFVTLELLDLLLEKGYSPSEIHLESEGIILTGPVTLHFRTLAWGREYNNWTSEHKPSPGQVFYSSQLSGGLIDRAYIANLDGITTSTGLFDHDAPYDFRPLSVTELEGIPPEFIVESTVLVAYKGTDEHVEIPVGITKIESGAFWNNCSIRSVILPDTVKIIGGDAFVYCESLESVNIPPSVYDIGDDPFAGCPKLVVINCSRNFINDKGVLFTSDRTRLIHYQPSLEAELYIIPDSVEWIGKHSFYNCNNLRKVIIGPKVDYIGNNPFSDCHHIVLENRSPNYVYTDGALMDRNCTTILHYSHGRDEDDYIMPDSVRTIGRNSFWNCKRIRRIVLGKNLRQIGYNPFANCSNLSIISNSPNYVVRDSILYDKDVRETVCCTDVRAKEPVALPNTVENIGRNSFAGCVSLKEISIPDSVKTISRGAFSHCESLKKVHVPDSVEIIEKWAFSYCFALEEISISRNTKVAKDTFTGSTKVKVITR